MRRAGAILLGLVACGDPQLDPPDASPARIDAVAAPPDAAGVTGAAAALRALTGVCTAAGWCWRSPTPQGNSINAAFSTSADNLWLVGERGLVMQWDGTAWRSRPLPLPPWQSTQDVGIAFGRGPDDMWIGAPDLLYHWDGASYTLVYSIAPFVDQGIYGVWTPPSPSTEVWVVLDYGLLQHSTDGGATFTEVYPGWPGLGGTMWGLAADDAWYTTRPGVVFHYDGATFTEVETGTLASIGRPWGVATDDIWFGGMDGLLLHWDGAALTPVASGTTRRVGPIVGRATDDMWMLATFGSYTGFLHWDGAAITRVDEYAMHVVHDVELAGDELWLPGHLGSVMVRPATPVALTEIVIPPTDQFANAIWGASERDIWVAGAGRIGHWDGMTLTDEVFEVYNVDAIDGLRSRDGLELWGVGQLGRIYHRVAGLWSSEVVGADEFLGVRAVAPGEAFAVGTNGTIYHRQAGTWIQIPSGTTAELRDVWSSNPDQAFIVGTAGTILRWDRATPDQVTPVTSPTPDDLFAIHGAGGLMWIASRSHVWKGAPGAFVEVAVPGALNLTAIHARSAADVYIAGSNGQLFHWNGTDAVEQETGVATGFSDLWAGTPDDGVWASTDAGGLLEQPP